MKFTNCEIIDVVRLYNNEIGEEGTAYVLDRLQNAPSDEQVEEWENAGAIVSKRVYKYAPEIKETFVFVPDSVMQWACPNEEGSGIYGENPQILDFDGHSWQCPNCHCSTVSPIDDACFQMIELV